MQFTARRPFPHAGVRSARAESQLRMRANVLRVRRPCSACGGSVLTCGDLFFKPSQPSRFITPPVLIASSVDLGVLNLLKSLFSRHCDFYKAVIEERPGVKGVASEIRSGDGQNRQPECATIR